jgi:signal transduction histidine kinase
LTKPIDSRELVARARAALETFRLKRVLEAQRRDHVAMLVHDLRHPLSSLALIAELLESEELTSQERQATVSQIRSMCSEMARLVDSVLAASRLEAGVFTVEPRAISVGAVVGPMLAVFTPVASRRRVALSFEGSMTLEVYADPHKLRQALDNVVANALKFTPRGGRVRVRVWRESEPTAQTVFEIADTGPGIAEVDRERIFDRYKQGSRGRAAGGAGLGLAIARGIAEAHHGSISVTTGEWGGATFRIALPG